MAISDEDLEKLSVPLGYSWPEDEEGRWRILKKMAEMAAYWRMESEECHSKGFREIQKEKLYQHQRRRIEALTKKVANLRRALRTFMVSQVAWVHEMKSEISNE